MTMRLTNFESAKHTRITVHLVLDVELDADRDVAELERRIHWVLGEWAEQQPISCGPAAGTAASPEELHALMTAAWGTDPKSAGKQAPPTGTPGERGTRGAACIPTPRVESARLVPADQAQEVPTLDASGIPPQNSCVKIHPREAAGCLTLEQARLLVARLCVPARSERAWALWLFRETGGDVRALTNPQKCRQSISALRKRINDCNWEALTIRNGLMSLWHNIRVGGLYDLEHPTTPVAAAAGNAPEPAGGTSEPAGVQESEAVPEPAEAVEPATAPEPTPAPIPNPGAACAAAPESPARAPRSRPEKPPANWPEIQAARLHPDSISEMQRQHRVTGRSAESMSHEDWMCDDRIRRRFAPQVIQHVLDGGAR